LKESPELQHELFSSMHSFITLMCVRHKQPAAAGKDLFLRLQGESFENPKELLSEIQVAATRIWTSTQKLQGRWSGQGAQRGVLLPHQPRAA